MHVEEAKRLIRETFQNSFDEGRFRHFAKNLFNDLDESKAFAYQGQYIPDAYKEHIRKYKRLGKYTDPDGVELDVMIVNLKRATSLDRARTMQRNFIAWYLKHRGEKDAAIVAYHTDGLDDWRFSYVRMDYRTAHDETGKVRVKTDLTPARRFSFLVGRDENSHTAQTRFVSFLGDDVHRIKLASLEEAFSIEKVTKEFFEKYHILYESLKSALDDILEKNDAVRADFAEKGVDTANFAKKTLGQIVFLYFLQKKGWFGVERGKSWGTGPKHFLRLLFDTRPYANFFNDILEPLFYEALAKERDQDYYSRFDCKIPFLNGGLFDPLNDYDWVHADIHLPDELFSNQQKTKEGDTGTGILDCFDRYNFTVKEDEPLEKEVAVDPEMLGKVFENLLEVKDRKTKGTYYTPREIVHYMCRECLIAYLDRELVGLDENLFLRRADIEFLIRFGEWTQEHDAHVHEKGVETERYSYQLPVSVRDKAGLIDEKLAAIRVCDPAVGSGAFLVGMMHEIVKARLTLTRYIGDQADRTPYTLKRHAIQNGLYGVDIDPGAVEIAKLRLWLSLIVDEEDIREIRPLPNLDYKIMQGNSLLQEYDGIRLFDEKLIGGPARDEIALSKEEAKKRQSVLQREYVRLKNAGLLTKEKETTLDFQLQKQADLLKKISKRQEKLSVNGSLFESEAQRKADALKTLHRELFEASQKSRKDRIRKEIEVMEWDLIEVTLREQNKASALERIAQYQKMNVRPFFLWKLSYSEVFLPSHSPIEGGCKGGGFDVVIANPPYVRQESIKEFKHQLKQAFGFFYCGTADLYTYFYKRGLEILKPSGHLCFIAPNKFMRAGYGRNTRTLLAGEATPKVVIDFGELPVFEAGTDPSIILVEKNKPSNSVFTTAIIKTAEEITRVEKVVDQRGFQMQVAALSPACWTLERPDVLALMEKLRKAGKPLGEYVQGRFYRGVLTGLNEAFVINEATRRQLITEDAKSADLIKPWLRGRDICKWKAEWAGLYIIFTRRGTDIKKYPAIKRHLEQFQVDLEPKKSDKDKRGRKPGTYKWFEIQDNIAYYMEFENPIIIYPDIATHMRAVISEDALYTDCTNFIMPADRYMLALIHSKLFDWYYRMSFQCLGDPFNGGRIRFKTQYMELLPIFPATDDQKAPIIERVRKILANPDSPTVPRLEAEIDKLVYDLYGLTEAQIAVAEGNI